MNDVVLRCIYRLSVCSYAGRWLASHGVSLTLRNISGSAAMRRAAFEGLAWNSSAHRGWIIDSM
jgi:hypothetical protein